ncbi:TBC1 domain family member 20-like [Morone saxatilis]|uniref:TBC1 domain family member 20-like n=1 Tax=Morone saxatilis TaxID=34816 RepID=UPI0015E1F9EA|nr:TBC1 domain family member 20-like [Morone saxatilis]
MKRLKREKQKAGVGVNGNGSVTREPGCGRKQKLAEIHQALISDPVDIETLRRAAASKGGLLTDELRRKVWPKLLNINVYELPHKPGRDVRDNHKDYNQVVLDVRRSMKRFPKGMPSTERAVLQEQLIDIILAVLKHNPQLHYYQGYHDVAVSLLLVVGEQMAIAMLDTLSNYHLRDFMDPTMDSTKHILNYLMPILEQVDRELHDFMIRARGGKHLRFPCPGSSTWVRSRAVRVANTPELYDFLPGLTPSLSAHLNPRRYGQEGQRSAQMKPRRPIGCHKRKECEADECDMAVVHPTLLRLTRVRQVPFHHLLASGSTAVRKSLSISTFQAFQLSTLHQRPDSVLRRLTKAHGSSTSKHGLEAALPRDRGQLWGKGNRMVKMAVWGLSATLGAAVFAVAHTAMDWGPEVLLQLF